MILATNVSLNRQNKELLEKATAATSCFIEKCVYTKEDIRKRTEKNANNSKSAKENVSQSQNGKKSSNDNRRQLNKTNSQRETSLMYLRGIVR